MNFFNQVVGQVQGAVQNSQQSQGGGQQQQPQPQGGGPQEVSSRHGDDGGPSVHLPQQLTDIINKYVDTFAPGISKGVSDEILAFENSTLGSLEQHVKDVISGIFHGDFTDFQSSNNINEFKTERAGAAQAGGSGPNLPQYNYPDANTVASRGDAQGTNVNLPEYGTRGLPFAGGTSAQAAATPTPDPEAPHKQKNIFDSALTAVTGFADKAEDAVQDVAEAGVKVMANKIKDLAGNIDQKVEEIIPDIKAELSKILEALHTGLADKMTHAALTCLKDFLAGAVKLEELGEEAVKGLEGLLSGFAGGAERAQDDPSLGHGPVGLLSSKLSGGLTVVRRGARGDFRDFLGKIEEDLFNSLPDGLKGPLSKIFGGDPFDPNAQAASGSGGGGGLLAEIGEKIKQILERIQQALRDRVLEVVSGGHRRLEDQAWGNVQDTVVGKVQHYVPGVQVKLQDDPQQ